MYDTFIHLVREELFSKKITTIPASRIAEYISFMKNSMELLPYVDAVSRKYFYKVLEYSFKDAEMLSRIRASKYLLGGEKSGESIDDFLYSKIKSMIDLISKFFSGLLVGVDNKIVVRVLKDSYIKDKRVKKNDLLLLRVDEALNYYLLGYVDIIDIPLIANKEFLEKD
ncbi:MAG: hypothetical protein J7L82_06785 [Staphylothermus sp.]|nr:hypothetical protein [Staphylothermus sp.]